MRKIKNTHIIYDNKEYFDYTVETIQSKDLKDLKNSDIVIACSNDFRISRNITSCQDDFKLSISMSSPTLNFNYDPISEPESEPEPREPESEPEPREPESEPEPREPESSLYDQSIATYEFENNTVDSKDNYIATWEGNESYGRGVVGQAALFDGNSSIEIDNKIDNILNNKRFSMSLFAKIDDAAGYRTIIGYKDSNDYYGFDLRVSDNNTLILAYTLYNGADVIIGESNSKLEPSRFYHICLVVEPTNGKVYIDGKAAISLDGNFDISNKSILSIGKETTRPEYTYYFKGAIDQVRVFDKPLTESEVQYLANEAN